MPGTAGIVDSESALDVRCQARVIAPLIDSALNDVDEALYWNHSRQTCKEDPHGECQEFRGVRRTVMEFLQEAGLAALQIVA